MRSAKVNRQNLRSGMTNVTYLRPVHPKSIPPKRRKKPPRKVRVVKSPVPSAIRTYDPLFKDTAGGGRRLAKAAGYGLLALMLHVGGVLALIKYGNDTKQLPIASTPEKVVVKIQEPKVVPPPEPPAPTPEPEPEAAPVQEVVKQTPVDRPKPAPTPKRRIKQPVSPQEVASADPVDLSDAPPPSSAPRRKIVGINFESTVKGGKGPAFAVGNSRMGETGTRAQEGRDAPPLPKGRGSGNKPSPNKVAAAIPSAGISLTKPKRKANVQPTYPGQLKAQGVEGNVVVLININASGRVTNVKVIRGSGYPEFDKEAVSAAQKERFSPALRNGEPIDYTLKYTYRFRVRES